MNAVGFDLGSSSLKLIEALKEGNGYRLIQAAQYAHPFGAMLPPDADQAKQLADLVKQVFAEHHVPIGSVRAALPESMVSTKIISTPPLSDAELASAIDWLAEQHIAIPLEELNVEYEVLYRPPAEKKNENMRVMLIGVPKKVIQQYMDFFSLLEIEPILLETQIVSILRSVMAEEMPTTLVVHMGSSSTDFMILHEKELVFVYSFPNGGQLFTRAIERGLNLDTQQAEEYKRSYGIDPQFLEGRLAGILDPVLFLFVGEIQKAMQYFTSQFGTMTVKRLLLSGGGAQMPGIVPSLASRLNLEVVITNPFDHFIPDTKVQIPVGQQAAFTIATGLVMRDL
jgi:type IV pilus assembly protein PilM